MILSNSGISIRVSGRVIGADDGSDISLNEIDSYSHVIGVAGGYMSCSFSFKISPMDAEAWLDGSLGKTVKCYDSDLATVWEGYINEIAVNIGAISIKLGPLSEIANKAVVIYSDDITNEQETTAAGSDTSSQAIYGIWYKVLSGGTLSPTTSVKARDTYLSEMAWPSFSQDITQGNDFSVSINCLGFNTLLNYPYDETGSVWTVKSKLENVLVREPNSAISADYGNIEANGLSILREETQNQTGTTVITSLVGLGGESDDNRRLWGVFDDRKFYYWTIPTTHEYEMYTDDGTNRVMDLGGGIVDPISILPGRWIKFMDLLPTMEPANSIAQDMHYMFIETVTFTAPSTIAMQGGKVNKLQQMLAKWMLRSN